MKRNQIIQYLIDSYGYKSYLEIGLGNGCNINSIKCETKIGIDPVLKKFKEKKITAFQMTSDDFFKKSSAKFDIIFIDGLHHEGQVYADIKNSLESLNEGGTIVCHDMNPNSELLQRVPRETRTWYGDCWKAWVSLREESEDLTMFVVDTDCGCGIIQKGSQEPLIIDEMLIYENLEKNRKKWLNLISVDEFKERINGTSTA